MGDGRTLTTTYMLGFLSRKRFVKNDGCGIKGETHNHRL